MARHPLGLAALLLSILGIISGCSQAPPPQAPPPPKVTVAPPEQRTVTDYGEYTGQVKAVEIVDVRSRVRGHLIEILFQPGQMVKKGEPLFQIDPRPFEADVERTRKEMARFEAQKKAAVKEVARLQELIKSGGASVRQLDKAEADVGVLEASIAASQQQVKRHELDLEYAAIKAPISGLVSEAKVTVGNLVTDGEPVLTSIVSINPMYVYFDIDERAIQDYMRKNREKGVKEPETVKAAKIKFDFGLDTDKGFPRHGELDFAENRADTGTGTNRVRGLVDNTDGLLHSGYRVRVRLPFGDPYKALLVPDSAVNTDQDKKYLLVVGADNIVQRRDVRLGRLQDDGMRVITSGLKPGEKVIVDGIQRARPLYPVEPAEQKP